MYPRTPSHPQGKLRLLYECNPIAWIIEQACGVATDGTQRILQKKPKSLHERTEFYAGSTLMVEELDKQLNSAKQ